jgi:hypothetical protein
MMGLIRGVARTAVIAGTATAVSNRVSRRQAGRWAEQDQAAEQQQMAAQQAAAPAPAGEPGYMEELQQLAMLRDSGILTDEEFEAKKRKLLGI